IVEKPREPISRRANIGLYYIRDWKLLYEGIDHVMRQPPVNGEFYLTDAFQYMIDHGARIKVIDVEGWYDAGKLDTLLDTNKAMLERGRARRPATAPGVRIFDPVYIEDGVVLERSTIGPNVSIGTGTRIVNSTIRDAVIGCNSSVEQSLLHDSMLGDEVVVAGARGTLTLGNHSEVRLDRDERGWAASGDGEGGERARGQAGGADDDRERAREAGVPVGVVEPLGRCVGVAAAAAGADRDGRYPAA